MKKERGNFRPVYTSIWDDDEFKSFDSDTKVVFFNLRTSRFGNWPCIYVMYPENVAAQTKLSLKIVTRSLMTLSMTSWIAHVPPVVWVIKGLRNDPNWNPNNPKQVAGIEGQLRSLPKNPLIARFCKFYGLSFPWVQMDDPIDTPIDTLPMERKPEDVSRKPEDVSRKPEEPLSSKLDAPPPYTEIISFLNEKTGKHFRPSTDATREHINARWKEGFRIEQFRSVIERKCAQWGGDPKMDKYLRPQTLFIPANFEAYLNEREVKGNGSGDKGLYGKGVGDGPKAVPGKYSGIGTIVHTDTPDIRGSKAATEENSGERGSAEEVS